MNLGFIAQAMLSGIVLYLLLSVFVVRLQQARWRRNQRRGLRTRFYPTTRSIGLALQSLQALAQPEVLHTLEEKLAEEAEEDDEGDPDHPQKSLERQLRRIRNGELVERLRVPVSDVKNSPRSIAADG